jgi:hypothetical protein
MTRVINANENEVKVDEPPVKLQKIGLVQEVIQPHVSYANREKAVSRQLRLEHLSEEKKDVCTNFRENICVLEKQLREQKANIKYRNLEGMLEEPRLSKEKWVAELSENNALAKRLLDELQNMKLLRRWN